MRQNWNLAEATVIVQLLSASMFSYVEIRKWVTVKPNYEIDDLKNKEFERRFRLKYGKFETKITVQKNKFIKN